MFDIGFWELAVIAIVALLVVGPERLPKLARDAGHWAGKLRRFVNQTKREIETELRITEGKEFRQQLSDLDDLMHNAPDQDPQFIEKQKIPPDKGKPAQPDQE
jgi:Tat protein translocase TatB subunit